MCELSRKLDVGFHSISSCNGLSLLEVLFFVVLQRFAKIIIQDAIYDT